MKMEDFEALEGDEKEWLYNLTGKEEWKHEATKSIKSILASIESISSEVETLKILTGYWWIGKTLRKGTDNIIAALERYNQLVVSKGWKRKEEEDNGK